MTQRVRPQTGREAARALLKQHRVSRAPVDVEALATKLGAVISYAPYKEALSGVLVKEKTKTVIGVNSAHPKTRQRFTIAHELGHLALEHQGELFVDEMVQTDRSVLRRDSRSSRAVDAAEIEANRFAAELLMPEPLVLEALVRRQTRAEMSQEEIIQDLAREFQVSAQAMEYRLTNLGIFMPR